MSIRAHRQLDRSAPRRGLPVTVTADDPRRTVSSARGLHECAPFGHPCLAAALDRPLSALGRGLHLLAFPAPQTDARRVEALRHPCDIMPSLVALRPPRREVPPALDYVCDGRSALGRVFIGRVRRTAAGFGLHTVPCRARIGGDVVSQRHGDSVSKRRRLVKPSLPRWRLLVAQIATRVVQWALRSPGEDVS